MGPLPPTPFPSGWWSFGLKPYRPCDSTYCLFPYESLPPLPEPDSSLSWLHPLPREVEREMSIHWNSWAVRGRLEDTIAIDARRLGLALPDVFVLLMSYPELQDRIPSCTACTFGLPDRILPCPGADSAYVVPFLCDQQGLFTWCLYLTARGDQGVVTVPSRVTGILYGGTDGDAAEAAFVRETRVCAPTFASFIYRFWLENTIGFKLFGFDHTPLTDIERRYVEHYEHENTSGS